MEASRETQTYRERTGEYYRMLSYFRERLKQLLSESGIIPEPEQNDSWILDRIAGIIRSKAQRLPRIGVNVFVKKDGKILMGRRRGGTGEGEWCLPGGKLEFNERFSDCAFREVEEECGITLESIRFVNLNNDPRSHEHWLHVNYEATTQEEPRLVEPKSFSEWGWFSLHELPQPVFYGHRKLIEAYCNAEIVSD